MCKFLMYQKFVTLKKNKSAEFMNADKEVAMIILQNFKRKIWMNKRNFCYLQFLSLDIEFIMRTIF